MYFGLHVKGRYSCQILMKLQYFRQIFEKYSEIRPVGSELFYAGGRRDMKISVAFRDFAKGA